MTLRCAWLSVSFVILGLACADPSTVAHDMRPDALAPRRLVEAPAGRRVPDEPPAPSGAAAALELLEFLECNPHPSQTQYPECVSYSLDAAALESPQPVELMVSAPGLADTLPCRLRRDPLHPDRIEVRLDQAVSVLADPSPSPAGRLLATLSLRQGRVWELLPGPGMPRMRATGGVPRVSSS